MGERDRSEGEEKGQASAAQRSVQAKSFDVGGGRLALARALGVWRRVGGVGAQALESEPVAASRPPWAAYARRQPEKTLLHKVVRENLETFLAEVRASNPEGRGLPGYVGGGAPVGARSAGRSRKRRTSSGRG